ncbi:MAG: extracellular solute-binding protein, partial [Trueperaceae bacterium]
DFALQRVADQFTEQTGIGVNIESIAYNSLQARLVNSFITGTADADVVTVDQMWISQYADNGWIQPLDQFIAADSDTDVGDFLPEVLYSLSTWRNQMWTLPVGAYAQGVIYRPDLLEMVGLAAPPKNPEDAGDWTWEKYFEYVRALHGVTMGDTEHFGSVIVGAQPVPIVHMFTQLGASYGARWFEQFPEAPWDFTPLINSDANVAALEAYKELYDLSPPESINYVWFDAGTRFSQGDIGMFFWWTPYYYLVKNNGYMTGEPSIIKDSYDTAILPTLEPGGDNVVSLGGWSLGMPRTVQNEDEAWQFIKWATSSEGQKAMALVPDFGFQFSDFSRRSNYEDPELQAIYPYLETQLHGMALGNGKIARPPSPIYTSLEGVYGLQLSRVLSGEASAKEALDTTNVLFDNILRGNQQIPYLLDSYNDTLENTRALIAKLAS